MPVLAVHKLSTPDRHYDLQLMRDMEIINTRTRIELGPLPLGGVAIDAKRKPCMPSPFCAYEMTHDEIREDKSLDVKHLAIAAAVAVANGCSSEIGVWHMKSKVEDGVLKIPFHDHVFGARCYDTLRCRVLYDNAYIVKDDGPRGPFTARDRDNLGGGWGNLDFPSVARVNWVSKDGASHDEKIDLGEIFRSRMVRYADDLNVNDVDLGVPPSAPDITLVVEDRSIHVYMKAWVWLIRPRFPNRKNSDFRHDSVVVYSQKF